jgi:hypothetical protein
MDGDNRHPGRANPEADSTLSTRPAPRDPYFAEPGPGEEPQVVGTLFLCSLILVITAAIWVIMYLRLLDS